MVLHRSPKNQRRWLHTRRHPIPTEVKQNFRKQCLFLWHSLPKHPVLTEVPSDLCDHNGPTSELNKYKSTRTITFTSSGHLPVFPIAPITDRSCFKSLRPQWSHIGAQLYWQKILLILATIMVPHRSPINTSRWLMMATCSSKSYTDRSSSEVPQAVPFPLTPFYPVSPKVSYTDRSSFWSLRP